MSTERVAKVNRLIQTTLAELVPGKLRDPRVAAADVISIVAVRTTRDLSYARVIVAVGAPPAVASEVIEGLRAAGRYLRAELGRRLTLRRVPELRFELDEAATKAATVEGILRELAQERREPLLAEPEQLAAAISDARRILVTSHPRPDGDSIGSTMAAYWALKQLGKDVVAFCCDPVPLTFTFLPGVDQVVDRLDDVPFDVTLLLDCSDARMFPEGKAPDALLGTVLVVDHHRTLGDLGHLVYCDTGAASVGVMLYRLFELMKLDLSLEVATALYCSVLSDTGSFRYQNTNPEALEVAAQLVRAGVDPWHVASNLYETRPASQLGLLARVLQTLCVSDDGRAAALTVTRQMLEETGCTSDMVDGFVNYARGLRGVEVAILLRPDDGAVRVSLRSRGDVDVSEIALGFGGGGHRNAAGATIQGADVDQVRSAFFAAVSQVCDARNG